MHYTQLFRSLREAKGLTIEGLAELADCHRNTVTNVESGRPVKFKTIADLMGKMGYTAASTETRSIALLWLEAVSGIPFSQPRTEAAALKSVAGYRRTLKDAARQLEAEAIRHSLPARQIDLLIYAIRHPEMLSLLENVRDLVVSLNAVPGSTDLKVAEESED
jgi:transcriptional regulator with XRE-family HTH domain